MLDVVRRSMRSPELRRKVLFTLGVLVLFRVGSRIPAPGISYEAVQSCVAAASSDIYSVVNLFTGGALLQLALLALGVIPYITASIMLQLLTVVVPRLEELKKQGQQGQAKITQYTRYTTVALALLQGGGVVLLARGTPSQLFPTCNRAIFPDDGFLQASLLVVALAGGAVFSMWLGEQITERGIGNGISLIVFASIAAGLPTQALQLFQTSGVAFAVVSAAAAVLLIIGVVFVEQAQRRITVYYSGTRKGSPSKGRQTTYLPLKVNQAGVIPVIFASSVLTLPTIISGFLDPTSGFTQFVTRYLTIGNHPAYISSFLVLVIFFAFFYVSITFDSTQRADELRAAGGFIPGVRPGQQTASYLDSVLARLTTAGSVYLALVSVLPLVVFSSAGTATQAALGGTSVLILVGVALETVKQLEAKVSNDHLPRFLSR